MDRFETRVRELGDRTSGGRTWYQYVDFGNGVTTEPYSGGRAKFRTETFASALNELPLSPSDRVLDIGCNAGLFTLICAQRCEHALGVEIDPKFVAQGAFLKEFYRQQGWQVDNADIREQDLIQALDIVADRTVILASKVLYHKHLGDGLFRLMRAIQNAPVHTMLIQGHTTQGEFGQVDGVSDMLDRYGFDYAETFADDEYPIGIAKRRLP